MLATRLSLAIVCLHDGAEWYCTCDYDPMNLTVIYLSQRRGRVIWLWTCNVCHLSVSTMRQSDLTMNLTVIYLSQRRGRVIWPWTCIACLRQIETDHDLAMRANVPSIVHSSNACDQCVQMYPRLSIRLMPLPSSPTLQCLQMCRQCLCRNKVY